MSMTKKQAYIRVEVDGTKPITRTIKNAALVRVAAQDWKDNREVSIEVQTVAGYPVVHVSIMREVEGQIVGESYKLEMN